MVIPTIVHVIDSLSMGGAETLLKNTVALFPEFRHTIVCLETKNNSNNVVINNANNISLGYSGWKSLPAAVIKLRKIISQQSPLLVHSHLFYATICTRLATPVSVPLVTTLHSTYSIDAFQKNRKSIWAERLTLKKRHALIGVSNYVLKDYLSYVAFKGNKYVLYNFLPDKSFALREQKAIPANFRCLALGNLKEAKNYSFLLQMMTALKDLNISLDIYGEGALRNELQQSIDKEKLKVRLCGKAGDVQTILKTYDLFIQASSHEGFGLSVIEAMAVGLPVFISDIPVFREITGGHAHFFSLQDVSEAAGNLRKLCHDKVLRNEHIAEGFRYCRQNYSSTVYKRNLLTIYEAVTNRQLDLQPLPI